MAKPKPDDEQVQALIARARTGDHAAFRALVRAFYERIYRWALAHTRDRDDADDVTQRVLLIVHRRLGAFREEARFTTWLYRIVQNEANEMLRKRKRRRTLLDRRRDDVTASHDTPHHAAALDREALVARVMTLFDDLPPRQREIFDLVDLQGFDPTQVAEMLNMNPNTVRANLFKARRALRRRLVEEVPELASAYHDV